MKHISIKRFIIAASAAALLLSLAACGNTESTDNTDSTVQTSENATSQNDVSAGNVSSEIVTEVPAADYSDKDLAGTWDESEAVTVELSETYEITTAGVYVLTGTLKDGQVIVNAGDDDKVQLVLNGVSVTCSEGPAIYVKNADKVTLTLAEGTENNFQDGSVYADTGDDAPNAAVFSTADMTINGSGTLAVSANYADGIVSKDDLVITDGNITVTSTDDALRGTDSVAICGGTLELDAGGDGIKSTKEDNAEKGWVEIDGGTITIQSVSDGIDAMTVVTVTDGKLTIDAGDDGIHAESALYVIDGIININESYEGLEAAVIEISGGEMHITSSDDGLNASDGSGSMMGGGPMGGYFSANSALTVLITGGYLDVDAGGDGLDSNGSLTVTGGTVLVNGPTNSANGALDHQSGNISVLGGIVAAAGASGMAETFDSESEQPSVLIVFDSTLEGGTAITLCDAQGNTVISFSPLKSFSSIVFSTPDLVQGETYTIYTGGTLTGDNTDELYGAGSVLAGGTEYETVTLTGISTTVGNAGGMGGFNQGNMNPGDMNHDGMGHGGMGGQKPGGFGA